MTAHAWWRVYFYSQNAYIPSIAKLDFRATIGGADQAHGSGGTAIASSEYPGGYDAAKAFDENAGTLWSSNTNAPAWVGYHFTAPVTVMQVVMQARNDVPDAFRDATIQWSDDGDAWEDDLHIGPLDWFGGQIRTFNRPDPAVTARSWWRLMFDSNNGANWCSATNVEFRSVAGVVERAVGGTSVGSSQYGGDYQFPGAFDADNTTAWATLQFATLRAWIGYHFAAPKDVVQLAYAANWDGGIDQAMRDGTVQSSDDGVTWQDEWKIFGQLEWLAGLQRLYSRQPLHTLPTVKGRRIIDIDPLRFEPGVRVDGTALTSGNTMPSLVRVNNSAVFHNDTFDTGRPSIRTTSGLQGFLILRPVQDDFSLYLVIRNLVGTATGALWYQSGGMMDAEASGNGNDYGVNLRADGKLIAGTGNPDVSTVGTHLINDGGTHIIEVVRVKSTGVMRVYVDGVLDITHNGNVATLNYSQFMYFGRTLSVGQTYGDFGRFIAYDAAHSDAERGLMRTELMAEYVGAPPTQPTLTYESLGPGQARLTGSAFAGSSSTHLSSRWQIADASDTTFVAPTYDSGVDAVHLTTIDISGISPGSRARVRYTAADDLNSPWSDSVVLALDPVFSFAPSHLPWHPTFRFGATDYALTYPVTRWIPGARTSGFSARSADGKPGNEVSLRRYTLGMTLRFTEDQWPLVRTMIRKAQSGREFLWFPNPEGDSDMPTQFLIRLDSPRITEAIRPQRDQQYQHMLYLPIVVSSRSVFHAYYFPTPDGFVDTDPSTPTFPTGQIFVGLGPPGVYGGVGVAIAPYYRGTVFSGKEVMNSKGQLAGYEPRVDTGQSLPITITFGTVVGSVTITCYDPTLAGNYIIAYDAANVELGRAEFLSYATTQTVTYPGIKKVVLQPAVGDFIAFYDLMFTV